MNVQKVISAIFKNLAVPQRLSILLLLADGPMSVNDLCAAMRISPDPMRRHLRFLSAAGLVKVEYFRPTAGSAQCRLANIVTVTEDELRIHAAGLPVTIGRSLQETPV